MTDLGMLQWPEEIGPFLIWLAAREPQVILEIGTGPGGVTDAFCRCAPRVISIDLPSGSSSGLTLGGCLDRNAQLAAAHPGFTGLLGDSHDYRIVERVAALLEDQAIVDLLFIDGDHRYAGVSLDFRTYAPFVRPGGWIGFHDIHAYGYPDVDVHQFWSELPGVKKEWSVRGGWGGIGVLQC